MSLLKGPLSCTHEGLPGAGTLPCTPWDLPAEGAPVVPSQGLVWWMDLVWGPASALRDHAACACSALQALCMGDHVILLGCGGEKLLTGHR